jgi:hypothetical protein
MHLALEGSLACQHPVGRRSVPPEVPRGSSQPPRLPIGRDVFVLLIGGRRYLFGPFQVKATLKHEGERVEGRAVRFTLRMPVMTGTALLVDQMEKRRRQGGRLPAAGMGREVFSG